MTGKGVPRAAARSALAFCILALAADEGRAQVVGSTCDVTTFAEVCASEDTLLACESDKVVEAMCPSNELCCITGPSQVGCVPPHSGGGCPSPGGEGEGCGVMPGGSAGGLLGLETVLGALWLVARRRRARWPSVRR